MKCVIDKPRSQIACVYYLGLYLYSFVEIQIKILLILLRIIV